MTEIAELGRAAVDDADGQATFDDVVVEVTTVLTGWPGTDERLRDIVARALGGEEAVAMLAPGVGDELPERDDFDVDYAHHRVVDVEKVATGVALTHRLTAEERDSDRLDVQIDLALLGHLGAVYGGLHLPDGTPLWRRLRWRPHPEHRSLEQDLVQLQGPPGWLQVYEPGSLVVCSAMHGVLTMAPVDDDALAPVPDGLTADLAEATRRSVGGNDEPVPAAEVQLLLAVDDPSRFAEPLPPFGELVGAAGLMSSGNEIGRPDTWAAIERPAELIGRIQRRFELPEFAQDAFEQVMDAFDRWRDGEPAELSRGLARRLGPEQLAPTVLSELRVSGAGWDEIEAFAREWADLGADGRAVMHWFTARVRSARGDPLEAERLLREAHEESREFTLPLVELAELREEQGDFRGALRLLGEAGEADGDEADRLQRLERLSSPDVGRNELCPCGSGRKFKQCHLGRSLMSGPEQMRWILACAERFMNEVADPKSRGRTARLADHVRTAEVHVEDVADEDDVSVIRTDLELFDEGWFKAYLEARGQLLGEAGEAYRRWAEGHRSSVFRVEDHDADDKHIPVVDLATGERYAVDREAVGQVRPHRLIWCRLIPVGEAWGTTGAFRSVHLYGSRQLLDVLADGSVDDALEALVRGTARPAWQAPDGEPLVDCRDELRLVAGPGDRETVTAILDEAFEADENLVHPEEEEEWEVVGAWAVRPPERLGHAPVGRIMLLDDGRVELSVTTLSGRARERERLTELLGEFVVERETARPRNRRDVLLELYETVEQLVRGLDEQARKEEEPEASAPVLAGLDTEPSGRSSNGNTPDVATEGTATEGPATPGSGAGKAPDDGPVREVVEEIADGVIAGWLQPDEVDWSRISTDPQVQEMFRDELSRLGERSDELSAFVLDLPRAELGGRDLREAAEDPDRRPEVLTLLAEEEDFHGRDRRKRHWLDRVRAELGV